MYKFTGLFLLGAGLIVANTYKSDVEVEAQIDKHMAEREMIVSDCVRDYKAMYKNKHFMNVADICDMVVDGERAL